LRSYPATQANREWADAYFAKYKEMPTNWSWENAVGINFLTAAMKKTNSSDGKKMAAAMKGMTINSPFGSNGTLTLRAEDHTLVDYAIGWGPLIAKEPYMPIPTVGDWKQIKELEAEWKKSKGWA
jgi:branched-chain amino acid transport system substrate-binding protein